MARPSSTAQQRQLTLTEELEKLEQSITLTLQEIDHNFSRAHRIVTSSILPIVEQYANHSRDVWEGSKFWKQFFESSANVSLSGYEEQSISQDIAEETVTEDSNTTTHASLETSESYETPSAQHISTNSINDLDFSNMTMSPSKSSTPRPSFKQQAGAPNEHTATFADYPSPYEALRQEVNPSRSHQDTAELTQDGPTTPGRLATFVPTQETSTPQSSPFLPPHTQQQQSAIRPSTARKKTDPLLHRVLDRTYRIQATPLNTTRNKPVSATTPGTSQRTRHLFDSALSSSPEAPPELHEELFSPGKRGNRTPGVSVLTPARNQKKQNAAGTQRTPQAKPGANVWDSDDEMDDSDLVFDGSPPKTIQFHVPQNRLLKTPAQEASKRMVQDILRTAGVGNEDEEEDGVDIDLELDQETELEIAEGRYRGEAYDDGSPSVVRKAIGLEDETF